MALVMQQKASVGRFDVYFGLDLYRFVKELHVCQETEAFHYSPSNLTEEWQWLRVSRKLFAEDLSGIIVNMSSTYLL